MVSSTAASHYLMYVDTRNSADSGVALCNPSSSNVSVTLNLRDTSGSLVAQAGISIPANGHMAQFMSQMFPDFREFEGTLEIFTSGVPIGSTALRFDNPDGSVFTTTPVIVIP